MSMETQPVAYQLPTAKRTTIEGEVVAEISTMPGQDIDDTMGGGQPRPALLEKRVDIDKQPVPSSRQEIQRLVASPDTPLSLKTAASISLELGDLEGGFTKTTEICNATTSELLTNGNQLIQSSREARDYSCWVVRSAQNESDTLRKHLDIFDNAIKVFEAESSGMVDKMDADAHAYAQKAGSEGVWGKDYINQERPATETTLGESSAYAYGAFRDLFRYQVAKKLLDHDREATTRELSDATNTKLFIEQELVVAQAKIASHKVIIDKFIPEAEIVAENENQMFQGSGLNASMMDDDIKQLRAEQIVLERIKAGEYDVSEFYDDSSNEYGDDGRTAGQTFADDYQKLTSSVADKEDRLSKIRPVFEELTKKHDRLERDLQETNLVITGIEQAEEIPQGFITLAQAQAKLEVTKRLAARTEASGKAKLDDLASLGNSHNRTLNELQSLPKPKYESPISEDQVAARRLGEVLAQRGVKMPNLEGANSSLEVVADMIADVISLRSGNPEADPRVDNLLGSYVLNRVRTTGIDVDRQPEQAVADMVMVYQGLAERVAAESAVVEAAPVQPEEPVVAESPKAGWLSKFMQ